MNSSFGEKYKFLTPVIGLLVFISIGYVHFDLTNFDEVSLKDVQEIKSAGEFFWRIMWIMSSVVTLSLGLACIYVAASVVKSNTHTVSLNNRFYLWLSVAVIFGLIFYFFENFNTSGGVGTEYFIFAKDKLDIPMQEFVNISMSLVACAVILTTVSSCSIIYGSGKSDGIELSQKFRDFRESFYITSAFLAIGLLQLFTLYYWLAHGVSEPVYGEKQELISLLSNNQKFVANGLAIGGSILYTSIIIIILMPVSMILKKRVERLSRNEITRQEEDVKKWKEKHGFLETPRQHLRDMLVYFSPVIIGFMTNVLQF